MQRALAPWLVLGLACALGCAGGDPPAVDPVPGPPAPPAQPAVLVDETPPLPEPLSFDPTDVTVEELLPQAWSRAIDWSGDAVLTSIRYETGPDGLADLTRNPGALMFNFFSASAEASKLVVPTTRVDLALVHSSYSEGHYRIPLPETLLGLSVILKHARRDGFEGRSYQAVLHPWPDADGDSEPRFAWTIRHTGHHGSHSPPLLYDAVTGEPTTPEDLLGRDGEAVQGN